MMGLSERPGKDRGLALGTSPGALFAQMVSQALGETRVETSPMATAYLIGLLGERVRTSDEEEPSTLAEAWLEARSASGGARIRRLRGLGDRALFVAGFFGESLDRKVVSRSYYRDMGRSAYRAVAAGLSGSASSGDAGWPDLFEELADRFPELMQVLAEVSVRAHGRRPAWLLHLYERYLATGSSLDRRRLVRAGCVPPPGRRRRWQ
jgi:hypothetical protein